MKVVLSPAARAELWEIWHYNAKRYNATHADDYEAFLTDGIAALATAPEFGDPVEGFPDRRAMTIKRRMRGHGHIAIYRIEETAQTIRILHVFHTAQDVRGRMETERPS